MDFKDYYAALGVAPEASEADIKSAYRKLARQYHPDVNPGDTKAEDRFKEVNEAYQVLGDTEQRGKYDEMRQQYQRWQQNGNSGGNFNYSQWQNPGGYQQSVSPEDFEDIFGGAGSYSDFFSSIFGGRSGGASYSYEPRPRRGRDLEVETEVTLEEVFHGATRSIQVGGRTIEARIPRGVQDGVRVRLAGQGGPGSAGGSAGDLFLLVTVLPHERFERTGDDLTTDVDVDFLTAATGGEARVRGLDATVKLRIPQRTQAGTRFRLRGKGLPRVGSEERGDLFARVRLVLPDQLSEDDLATLAALKRVPVAA